MTWEKCKCECSPRGLLSCKEFRNFWSLLSPTPLLFLLPHTFSVNDPLGPLRICFHARRHDLWCCTTLALIVSFKISLALLLLSSCDVRAHREKNHQVILITERRESNRSSYRGSPSWNNGGVSSWRRELDPVGPLRVFVEEEGKKRPWIVWEMKVYSKECLLPCNPCNWSEIRRIIDSFGSYWNRREKKGEGPHNSIADPLETRRKNVP